MVCAVLIVGLGSFLVFHPLPTPPLTSIMGERQSEDDSTVFENGDSVYTPAAKNMAYDEDSHMIFFNNQLIAYTFSEMTDEYASELAGLVNGEVVGKLSGSINAVQIRVDVSTLDELNEMAAQLMTREDVLYAGYDYPVQLSVSDAGTDTTSAVTGTGTASHGRTDSNPWSADPGQADADRGDEAHPDGNDWWAEAIGAYTAWQYSDQCQPVKVGIVDNGFDADHEDLSGKISFLPSYPNNSGAKHGTHVAGIIGAQNNDRGIRGIADSADLVCVDDTVNTSTGDKSYLSTLLVDEMVRQLIENDAKVINNSWGCVRQSFWNFTDQLYGKDYHFLIFDDNSFLKDGAVFLNGTYDEYLSKRKRYG